MHQPSAIARLIRRATAAARGPLGRGRDADAWAQLDRQHARQLELAQHLRRRAAELAVERRMLAAAAQRPGAGDAAAAADATMQEAALAAQQQRLARLAEEVSLQADALGLRIAALRASGAGADALAALEQARVDATAASERAREAVEAATAEVDAARAYAQALAELREQAPPGGQ